MIVDSGTRYKTGELEDMILACPNLDANLPTDTCD